MIRITVELISARTGKTTTLGVGEIWNDVSGTITRGNYGFRLGKRGQTRIGPFDNVWKQGEVKGFPRQKLLAWDLLYRCLKEAVGNRNDN